MTSDAWRSIPAFVINLDRRADRWAQAQAEFARLAWPVTRVSAAEATPGWRGCLASHRGLWQRALDAGHPVVAVFEDDVLFPADFIDIIPRALQELPGDWEFWQLHSAHAKYRPLKKYLTQILSRGWGTHGYLVTASGCRRLLALPENKVDSLVTEDLLRAGGTPYGVVPPWTLCFQRGDDSDIAETAQTSFWRQQQKFLARRCAPGAKS